MLRNSLLVSERFSLVTINQNFDHAKNVEYYRQTAEGGR